METKLDPKWYAVGSVFAVPVCAALLFIMGALLVCCWPFIPFLCYMQRREEDAVNKLKTREVGLNGEHF